MAQENRRSAPMDELAETAAFYDRIRDEIADSVDEEMEMTLDEESLD